MLQQQQRREDAFRGYSLDDPFNVSDQTSTLSLTLPRSDTYKIVSLRFVQVLSMLRLVDSAPNTSAVVAGAKACLCWYWIEICGLESIEQGTPSLSDPWLTMLTQCTRLQCLYSRMLIVGLRKPCRNCCPCSRVFGFSCCAMSTSLTSFQES